VIHIGNEKTKRTLCGKSVKRRWWVSDARHEGGVGPGKLLVSRQLHPEKTATCAACIAKIR
jgi:hypothetical protein